MTLNNENTNLQDSSYSPDLKKMSVSLAAEDLRSLTLDENIDFLTPDEINTLEGW